MATLLYIIITNKTPAQAFTAPADEKKMGTIWILDTTAQAGADADISWSKSGGGSSFANMGFKSST